MLAIFMQISHLIALLGFPPLNLQVTSLWCPMKKRTLDTELQNPTEQIFPPKHTPYKMTVMGGWEIF